MRHPITLTPQGVMPRDPNLTIRATRVTPSAPAATAETTTVETEMPFMGASVWSTAQQDVIFGGQLEAQFDQELYDTDNIFDAGADPILFTVPVGGGGKWAAMLLCGATPSGYSDKIRFLVRVNDAYDYGETDIAVVDGEESLIRVVFPPVTLVDGDTVQFMAQPGGATSFGTDYTDPVDPAAISPGSISSIWGLFWRVGK